MPRLQVIESSGFSFSPSEWQDPRSVHHAFIGHVREAISEYRFQSAAHFNLEIEVCQATHPENPDRFDDVEGDFELSIGFYSFGTEPVFTICRPKTEEHGPNKGEVIETEVEVWKKDKFMPVLQFLNSEFPKFEGPVSDDVMFQWWNATGQTLNWTGLPTEIKERVLKFCLHQSQVLPVVKKSKGRVRQLGGAPEVTGQLGKWASLLTVSHQVRAITLRLCLSGSSKLNFSNGLCIVADDFLSLKLCIRRLEKYRQMTGVNSIPMDDKACELEKTYKAFPKIYPHLDQYATFSHGIRKMHLQFSFIDALHFFKVTAGSFSQHWKSHYLDYQVFETLPHLNELIIQLPDAKGSLEDSYQQPVRLFYRDPFNCVRTLHRLVYERAAEVLAHYKDFKMYGFIDEEEEMRFMELRAATTKEVKITEEELAELYKEDMGGIQLEESVIPGVEKKDMEEEERDTVRDDFWPPKCRCEVLCRQVLYPDSF